MCALWPKYFPLIAFIYCTFDTYNVNLYISAKGFCHYMRELSIYAQWFLPSLLYNEYLILGGNFQLGATFNVFTSWLLQVFYSWIQNHPWYILCKRGSNEDDGSHLQQKGSLVKEFVHVIVMFNLPSWTNYNSLCCTFDEFF